MRGDVDPGSVVPRARVTARSEKPRRCSCASRRSRSRACTARNTTWTTSPTCRAATACTGRSSPAATATCIYLMTRSIVFDLDWTLRQRPRPLRRSVARSRARSTGRKNVMQQIGPSLIWAPLLCGRARLARSIANVFGARHPAPRLHAVPPAHRVRCRAWCSRGSRSCLGARLARALLGGRWAPAFAGVAVLLGTSLTYYATYMPSYAHAMDAAACGGFLALLGAHDRPLRAGAGSCARRLARHRRR